MVDALFSESATAPTLPANYDQKRRIGAVLTDGSANILAFVQHGDNFIWVDEIADVLDATSSNTGSLHVISVPIGITVFADCIFTVIANNLSTRAYSPLQNAPSVSTNNLEMRNNVNLAQSGSRGLIATNTSAQVGLISDTNGIALAYHIYTQGWLDPRGKDT